MQTDTSLPKVLDGYRAEALAELKNILSFWAGHTQDHKNGGFVGQVRSGGQVNTSALKGAVLNARILWTFASAYGALRDPGYRALACRAYQYFAGHFIDREAGGVFWALHPDGSPASDRKQVYALAFGIYGLSEYYKISEDREALALAMSLFHWIEDHSYDQENGGYVEALDRTGHALEDMRLSEKDRNDPKTMNTHLHILEAYANLYSIWPNDLLRVRLEELIVLFADQIIDSSFHLQLFFDLRWKSSARLISYGHDIEASWLLKEASDRLNDRILDEKVGELSVKMAGTVRDSQQPDGSLFHETNLETGHVDRHREWWVSAEAMVGFLNAYQLSGDAAFLEASLKSWNYAKSRLLDRERGEWFWGIDAHGRVMSGFDKAGFWKCPYHNARACLEVVHRCENLLKMQTANANP